MVIKKDVKIAVFASGSGSNFENIVKSLEKGESKGFSVEILISDKKEALALERARKLGINCKYIDPRNFATKKEFEEKIAMELEKADIKYIVLAGYMRIISKTLLEKYDRKIINIHPAYLPEFPGKDGIGDAFKAGVSETGVTIHYVDSGIDTGEIIYQEKINIEKKWDLKMLKENIHKLEHKIYPMVLTKIFGGEK
nr:phosphoribosylglycinamide formyltransferase [uncultured Cetobacterium sp.]